MSTAERLLAQAPDNAAIQDAAEEPSKAEGLLKMLLRAYDSIDPGELMPDALNDNDVWDAVRVFLEDKP